MNVQNLKYFADAARLGSMKKSADINHLSRPAISQAIKKLEEEIGVELLVHKRRTFELTQAGLQLFKKSEPLFNLIDETIAHVKSGPIVGEFRIGSARTLANFALHKAIAKMQNEFPGVEFKVILENSETLVNRLENREVDVAFFLGDESRNNLKQVVVSRGSYCLVRPKKSKASAISYAITERRPETERLKVLFEREFGSELPVFAQIPSWDAIWSWIHSGECGGLVPDFLLTSNARKDLAVVFEKVFPYEMKVMFHKSKATAPLTAAFVRTLKEITS